MLDTIIELLAAASKDVRLQPFVSRLELARRDLEAKTVAADAVDSAKALLVEIEQVLGASIGAKQAAFDDLSKLVGHTPRGPQAGPSMSGPAMGSGMGPAAMVPLTIEEKKLDVLAKQLTRTASGYDERLSGFGGGGGPAVQSAKSAKAAYDHLLKTLEQKRLDYDKLRRTTPANDKKIDASAYGSAYTAYSAALREAQLKADELVTLAKAALSEVELKKASNARADSLFDDFLTFRKNASSLDEVNAWLQRRTPRHPEDPAVDKALGVLDKALANALGQGAAKDCKTPQALTDAVKRKMTEAEAMQAQAEKAAAAAQTAEEAEAAEKLTVDATVLANAASELDKVVVVVERSIRSCRETLEGTAAQKAKAERDKRYLENGVLKKDAIANDVADVSKGSTAALKETFDNLRYGRTSMSGEQIEQLYGEIVGKVLNDPTALKTVSNDPELCGDLILMAEKQGKLNKAVLDALGDRKSAVAQRVLLENTKAPLKGTATEQWMWDAVDIKDWNDKDKGISAQVYNSLWNNGDYDQICKLIAKGANAGQAHSLGQDTGRGSGKKEGIWSGFIQPLEHLLGNYVLKVHEFKENPAAFAGDELKKVQGAQKVLAALKGKAGILTDYEEIRDCDAIKNRFSANPGTIWGFEDVRLPYVQAAREKDKGDKGNQPLRMWELWKAVEKALNQAGYEELLQNPDAAIKKFVAEGKAAVALEVKDSHAYPNLDLDKFLEQFELQASAYLKHLSEQIPKGQFDTAELSGMDPGKLMGGLGCKAGLWWAKESKRPVYYCMDGINTDEALDYKAWKNAKIKANLEEGGSKHFEVITFAEIREILKNWDQLKDTVVFIEKGAVIGEAKILEWRKTMLAKDGVAGKRPAPSPEKFRAKLEALGDHVWQNIEKNKGAKDYAYDAMKVTVKSEALIRVTKMARKDVLPKFLDKKGELLVQYGVIPKELATASQKVIDATSADELTRAKVGFTSLIPNVPPSLQGGLSAWVKSVNVT